MPEGRLHIRRSRRTDFVAVMELLAATGTPVPPPDRATLRRFRALVADLGSDFYLAFFEGTLAGLVHISYTRCLARPPAARIEQLLVAGAVRRRGIGSALLAFARQRGQQRGCGTLSCCVPPPATAAQAFLTRAGLQPQATCLAQELQVQP